MIETCPRCKQKVINTFYFRNHELDIQIKLCVDCVNDLKCRLDSHD